MDQVFQERDVNGSDVPEHGRSRGLVINMRGLIAGIQKLEPAFFVIQMADVLDFAPNDTTHPAFGEALREAARRGVEVAAYTCRVTPETVTLDAPVPVRL